MGRITGSWWNVKGAIARLAILAALWTLILVTLLSALAPLGPPLSRATGSAFNPATADVVLKARAQTVFQMVETPRPAGDGAPPPLILALVLGLVLLAFHHARPTGATGRHRNPLKPLSSTSAHRARAPPAAF